MKLLIWNIRGLKDLLKQNEVLGSTQSLSIDVCCIVETKVKEANKEYITSKWLHWSLWTNHTKTPNGRIWVFAKKEVPLTLLQKNSQFMHFSMLYAGVTIAATFIYSSNDLNERKRLPRELLDLQHSITSP